MYDHRIAWSAINAETQIIWGFHEKCFILPFRYYTCTLPYFEVRSNLKLNELCLNDGIILGAKSAIESIAIGYILPN